MKTSTSAAYEVAAEFTLSPIVNISSCAGGHINESFVVEQEDGPRLFVQRVNTQVFPNPVVVMENVQMVTEHLRTKYAGTQCCSLELAPLESGAYYQLLDCGSCWRAYHFVEHSVAYQTVNCSAQLRQAGEAFGEFQNFLADLPVEGLKETIPDFHNSPKRFEHLLRAIHTNKLRRAAACGEDIAFCMGGEGICRAIQPLLESGQLPTRICHNDAKLNNLLFHRQTGEPLCIVDLDTVMAGSPLYDFGDLVRTGCSESPENDRDLASVDFSLERFEALVQGYLSEAEFLTAKEVELLPVAGEVITFETGMRFLTDYLEGDRYFRTSGSEENLHRARRQFALIKRLRATRAKQLEIINRYR